MAIFARKQVTLEQVRNVISEKVAVLQKVGTDQDKRSSDLALIGDKEEALRAAAYGQGDADALVKLKQLRDEKAELAAHLSDLGKYAAAVGQELTELRKQEADLVLKAKRDDVEVLLKDYVSRQTERVKQVQAIAQRVRQIISDASADDLRLSESVRVLHPERLAEFADGLRTSSSAMAAAMCSALLADLLAGAPSAHLKSAIANPEAWLSDHVDQIKETVNALPSITGEGQGAGLYEANHQVGGLKGHRLNAGDVIRLRKSEAAELVASGALRLHGETQAEGI
jgi:hypothetical protein